MSTGIIRRIDELGRIVIPKEIRKNLRIKNGDNLEILVDGDNITLRKYSQIENATDMASVYAESFCQVLKYNVIVTDTDMEQKSMIKKRQNGLNCLQNRGIHMLKWNTAYAMNTDAV